MPSSNNTSAADTNGFRQLTLNCTFAKWGIVSGTPCRVVSVTRNYVIMHSIKAESTILYCAVSDLNVYIGPQSVVVELMTKVTIVC